MALPKTIARLNKRYTNRFIEPLVSRLSGFIIVEHTGRRSGTTFRTPLYGFDGGAGTIFVALTYGPDADWAQNVIAGGGVVDRRGQQAEIQSAEVVGHLDADQHVSGPLRAVLRALTVTDFLQLRLVSA